MVNAVLQLTLCIMVDVVNGMVVTRVVVMTAAELVMPSLLSVEGHRDETAEMGVGEKIIAELVLMSLTSAAGLPEGLALMMVVMPVPLKLAVDQEVRVLLEELLVIELLLLVVLSKRPLSL